MEEQTAQPTKPRNAFIAFSLSIFTPGLGQIYNGQFQKGVIFFALTFAPFVIFRLTNACHYFYGLVTLLLALIVLQITIIVDAVINAKRQKKYISKSYNTFSYHLLIAFVMLTINWLIDTRSIMGIQFFSIPTTSNNPTFQDGDWVVSDKNAYKNKQLNYGDIVAFNSPKDGIWTFRVVGLPNDTLALNENIVTVNGKVSKATFVKETTNEGVDVQELVEELPNGHKHHIYRHVQFYDSTKANIQDIIVPADCYYLLGDNRDNANDSRYIGPVKRQDIVGQIIYSYWGKTTSRINIDFRDK